MRIIAVLFFFFFSLKGFSQSDTTIRISGYDDKETIKISYPTKWSIDTSRIMGTRLFVFAPMENKDDKFRENVNVLIQDLRGMNMGMKEYKELSERQVKTQTISGKLYKSVIVRTKNGDCYQLLYSMKQNGQVIKAFTYAYIIKERAYVVTFTAEFEKFAKYRITGEKILNSFSLLQ